MSETRVLLERQRPRWAPGLAMVVVLLGVCAAVYFIAQPSGHDLSATPTTPGTTDRANSCSLVLKAAIRMNESDDRNTEAVEAAIDAAHHQDPAKMNRMWDQTKLYAEDALASSRSYNTNLPGCLAESGCRADVKGPSELWADARSLRLSREGATKGKALNVTYQTGTDSDLDAAADVWRGTLTARQQSYEQLLAALRACP